MRQLIGRFCRVADSSSSQRHRRLLSKSTLPAPEGHLPVYVGEEMVRFIVPADLISRPLFVELLRLSAQEYGYNQRGVLRIPCTVELFQRVLDLLGSGSEVVARILPEEFAVDVSWFGAFLLFFGFEGYLLGFEVRPMGRPLVLLVSVCIPGVCRWLGECNWNCQGLFTDCLGKKLTYIRASIRNLEFRIDLFNFP